jgi:hypothetical protein
VAVVAALAIAVGLAVPAIADPIEDDRRDRLPARARAGFGSAGLTLLGIVTARAASGAEVGDRAGPDPPPRALRSGRMGVPPPARAEDTSAQPRRGEAPDPDPSGVRRSLA